MLPTSPISISNTEYNHSLNVVGLPDKRMGEEVCAAIRVKEGITLTEQEVKDFCKGNVSYYTLSLIKTTLIKANSIVLYCGALASIFRECVTKP